jgi:hypothetical protein
MNGFTRSDAMDTIDDEFGFGEAAWRICHVCCHRYGIEFSTGSLDPCSWPRPLLCPRCGVIGRDRHGIYPPSFIRNMYGIYGSASLRTSDHVLVQELADARSRADVKRVIDVLLRTDAEAIVSNTPPSDDPEDEAERLRALEWIRKDLASGLHESRLRDLGKQALAVLHAEREHHLELLRRRQATGLRTPWPVPSG